MPGSAPPIKRTWEHENEKSDNVMTCSETIKSSFVTSQTSAPRKAMRPSNIIRKIKHHQLRNHVNCLPWGRKNQTTLENTCAIFPFSHVFSFSAMLLKSSLDNFQNPPKKRKSEQNGRFRHARFVENS